MDYRTPLKFNTILAFEERMTCHIEEVVGQGSNAIVYKGWYLDNLNQDLRHHVLIKELFPFESKEKIYRNEKNHLVISPEANDIWNRHRNSFEIGNQIHLYLLQESPDLMAMGMNLNSFQYNNTLYSVLGYTGGRSLQEELHRKSISSNTSYDANLMLRQIALRMIRLLNALEAFHKNEYLHLDISPDNIMLVGHGEQEQLFLIDYNSARHISSCEDYHGSYKTGYSALEVHEGNTPVIDFTSDFYSVVAVFYHCIMGRSLTEEESFRSKAPTGEDSLLLANAPQTVSYLVRRILRKGLHTLPKKRYQTIAQMRQVFQELIERIDCVGVTTWSLWENGKRSVEKLIRDNPSLQHLKGNDLYPIRFIQKEKNLSLNEYLNDILSPNGKSSIILAQGGMGKTTLLLHIALSYTKQYSSTTPAIFYLSLNGWNNADTQYIRTQILLRLRFKKEENTFQSAMHALHQILQQPLKTKTGEIPSVLLLLDGLNEIRDDIEPLLQEIKELNAMAGVRIIATSRGEIAELPLETIKLIPLHMEDIENNLGKHGLLIPKQQEVLELLRTPFILSIYIQTSTAGTQLEIQNKQDLLKAYLNALFKKETTQLTKKSPLYWQLDVAQNYILPIIAMELNKHSHTLTNAKLATLMEQAWKLFHSRIMKKVFPQWIGHSRDILADSTTIDAWYNIIIHNLLWKQLGILIKDTDDNYRMFHQEIEEYLLDTAIILQKRIKKYRIYSHITMSTILVPILGMLFSFILPYIRIETAIPYDEVKTEQVIENISICYNIYGSHLKQLQNLTQYLFTNETNEFLRSYERCETIINETSFLQEHIDEYQLQLKELSESGEQVAWSKLPFDDNSAKLLITYAYDCLENYKIYLPLLKNWAESDRIQKFCPDFPTAFQELLTADARYMSKLYYQSCYPHLEKGDSNSDEVWEKTIRDILVSIPEYDIEPTENLESLQDIQKRKKEEFANLTAILKQVLDSETHSQ